MKRVYSDMTKNVKSIKTYAFIDASNLFYGGERTAREIRQLAGNNFQDFHYLREILRFKE